MRGEIDSSSLYITRTDLHELFAQALDAAGQHGSTLSSRSVRGGEPIRCIIRDALVCPRGSRSQKADRNFFRVETAFAVA
jgi:hypothetical protein